MVVGVLRLDLRIYSPQSLKEKRGIVRSLLGRIRSRYPVSCAETGAHDLWQRTELGVAAVGSDAASLHRLLEQIEDEVEKTGLAEICDRQLELLNYE